VGRALVRDAVEVPRRGRPHVAQGEQVDSLASTVGEQLRGARVRPQRSPVLGGLAAEGALALGGDARSLEPRRPTPVARLVRAEAGLPAVLAVVEAGDRDAVPAW